MCEYDCEQMNGIEYECEYEYEYVCTLIFDSHIHIRMLSW